MINILFSAAPDLWDDYHPHLSQGFRDAGLTVTLARDLPPEAVDYVIYEPSSKLQDFAPYTRLKAVLSLWAGVERIIANPQLTAPVTRMVDEAGLTQGMVEWVTGHALRHHLGMDAHIVNPDRTWDDTPPPLSRDRPVTILGLGTLGQGCGKALAALGFPVTGWSRTPKDVPGLTCLSGIETLDDALGTAQILVLLLPNTPATTNLLDRDRLARLPRGAVILNPGRGTLIDDDALLAALDSGQVSAATLDVFRVEPLPADHPYWGHPRVTVTPHIASATRPDTASAVVVENIRRSEAGEPLLHLVDKVRGY